ncbi:bifunctional riboflavin kinase/FAD synthetase [Legionella hackeliae]|uniref:Riboflavin biosynthesis protein n=1 Tax=Legionella hackeliae TaxID=449 RepID=A0A0A8UWQ6_LEGHA|nr:bifunctional riboflavin kinase/FAD synthetase [Legionella hackeliae]KTD15451.1 riboflavin biosynthesis protein RibF (riboflavin kinase/FMN adenylyltransferase) [Legionella hackeliae]CEK11179.1 Riboflavin biosynthesis protein ribF [Includes: Riboflavin kinase; FMN adenylyltransferase] [Legionella hackeliae]STX47945.1 riboflavin biosynthesis protein RibF (riboflavin kinase/FMN adenylyltransferase) [Legionella hackeliae]
MKLLRGLENIPYFSQGTVATIGNFDGVHRGHQALLAKLRLQADRMQLPLVVVLFEPQPGEFFRSSQAPARLATLREKLEVLKRCNVDYVCCLKFNNKLALMEAEDFARHYFFSLLKVKYLLVGEDFRFGRQRQGDIHLIQRIAQEQMARIDVFPAVSINGDRVSSTKIREALASGKLNYASSLLGRTYSLCGRVIKGDGRGKQWGIPTANLSTQRLALPLKGVFCIQVKRKGAWLKGVANLGSRPTVDGTKNVLEVHLFDFDESLYGEMLQVFFLHKLRDEIKFSSVDALIKQIHNDINAAKEFFAGPNLIQI